MKRKKYIANGFVELSIVVPLGSAKVRVEFTGGQQSNANGLIPASYTTTNAALQNAIENSPRFLSGFITIDKVQNIPDRIVIEKSAPEQAPKNENVFPEVTNVQQAKAILMEKFGVSMSELQNKEATVCKAGELNVKFPNWK